MTAYQFSQPWLSKLAGDEAATAREFSHLRKYLQGLDDGTIPLFNPLFLNATINALTVGGNIAMGGFKLTGLGAGSTNGDSLRYEQLVGLYLLLTGGTMSGAIAMGTSKITGLGNGTAAQDAAAFGQLMYISSPIYITNASSFATTSSTFATTNLTADITPSSASSRIKITVSGDLANSTPGSGGGVSAYVTLFRGTTNNLGGTTGFVSNTNRTAAAGALFTPVAFTVIDTPASTSVTNYNVRIRNDDNASSVAFPSSAAPSTVMILEEIHA